MPAIHGCNTEKSKFSSITNFLKPDTKFTPRRLSSFYKTENIFHKEIATFLLKSVSYWKYLYYKNGYGISKNLFSNANPVLEM